MGINIFRSQKYSAQPKNIIPTCKDTKKTKTIANGIKAFLNIVLHDDGKFYLYTISKNITIY